MPEEDVSDLKVPTATGRGGTSVVEQALRTELRRHAYEQEIPLLQSLISDDLAELADWNHRHFTMAD